MNDIKTISENEYKKIKNFIYDRFGISLGEKKQALVLGRLTKLLSQSGFSNFSEYYNYIVRDKTGKALNELVNRISTNHTYFNRENEHFTFFKETVLKEITNTYKKENSVRIWSAGCSSGEEPYTLAMLMLEYFGSESQKIKLKVLATDISKNALEKASAGIYSEENISKMPAKLKHKYFVKENGDQWRVTEKVRELVMFRRLNFMRKTFPFTRKFHCVFCRNVMIYFDPETREDLVSRFSRYMETNTYFFVGLSESLGRQNKYFKYIQPGAYRKIA